MKKIYFTDEARLEAMRNRLRAYRATPEGRERCLASTRRWYRRNIEEARARQRGRVEYSRDWQRQWREKNKDKHYAHNKLWRQRNPDKVAAQASRRRSYKRNAFGSISNQEWLLIIKRQKSRCAECGARVRLTLDHIVPISLGGSNMAINVQGLCRPCNSRKQAKIRALTQLSIFDRLSA